MSQKSGNYNQQVISHDTMRIMLGILGIFLPFILIIGGIIIFDKPVQPSISDYYHTGMRDVFVGSLWAIGIFLLIYRGPEKIDFFLAKLACAFAVAISLFPTPPTESNQGGLGWVGWLHYTFAGLFFAVLIVFTLFLFTKTKKGVPPTNQKMIRNRVYIACGLVMLVSILLIGLYTLTPMENETQLKQYNPVFWLETIAIVAFGISWFVKGEAILKDRANP
jgi:uncharacterized membrane protein YiaA